MSPLSLKVSHTVGPTGMDFGCVPSPPLVRKPPMMFCRSGTPRCTIGEGTGQFSAMKVSQARISAKGWKPMAPTSCVIMSCGMSGLNT